MEVKNYRISLRTAGGTDIKDLTPEVAERVRESEVRNGQALVFAPGATGAVTTIEYEPGLIRDLKEAVERLLPGNRAYHHNERWGDGNGHSHLRAALLGPSISIPIVDGRLVLGTWQQVVFIDFDNRPRDRSLLVQISGNI
ncbi:MAG TPA: secondary thiamine-phosphate synthase enzyme YjbQ [Syntrophales bacterium]|nr:secondary thiamine-phosphate synthase enzyme YjbQ [Syntrophales bacterium]